MKQRSIYIVLTRTTTVVSRLIAYITGNRYTHASISLDKNLPDMYSFGRKRRYNPLKGGFCRENLNEGIFADCKSLPYAIVKIKVTQDQYDKVKLLIQKYSQNAERYSYNYAGLLFAWIGRSCKSNYRFYCSEFVYDLLMRCEVICESPPVVIHPQELLRYGKVIEEGDWKMKKKKMKSSKLSELCFILKRLPGMV